jgi:small subunit ribosomal protein S16
VVATDGRSPRDGKFLEVLGWYDPKVAGDNCKLDMDRVAHWQKLGAQMSETVASLCRRVQRAAAKA